MNAATRVVGITMLPKCFHQVTNIVMRGRVQKFDAHRLRQRQHSWTLALM